MVLALDKAEDRILIAVKEKYFGAHGAELRISANGEEVDSLTNWSQFDGWAVARWSIDRSDELDGVKLEFSVISDVKDAPTRSVRILKHGESHFLMFSRLPIVSSDYLPETLRKYRKTGQRRNKVRSVKKVLKNFLRQ